MTDSRKTDRLRKNPIFILCSCGCGEITIDFDDKGRERKFLPFHHNRGSNNPAYGRNMKGELNYNWRGDQVRYIAVHQWVRKIKPIPDLCEICNSIPPYDLANITGVYDRDPKSYKYLCRPCHRQLDKSRRRLW